MDSLKRTRYKKCSKNNNKLVKNDMNVFSDSEAEDDKSEASLTTTTTLKSVKTSCTSLDIIVHKPQTSPQPGRLANSMSIDSSDTDADFVDTPQFSKNKISLHKKQHVSTTKSKCNKNIIKVEVNTPQTNRKSLKHTSKLNKSQLISSKKINKETSLNNSSKNIHTPNAQKFQSTPKTQLDLTKDGYNNQSSKIKVISNERVKIPVISLQQNKNNDKSRVARNIFGSTSSTSKTTNKCKELSDGDESDESISSSHQINVEIQTANEVFNSTNANTETTTNAHLKRPHNVATQTEPFLEISSDEEERENEEPVKRKVIQIQVSPPKKFKTIDDECPIMQLIDEHINKIEAVKAKLFSEELTMSDKILQTSRHTFVNTPKPVVKTYPTKTPMKQSTLTNFCRNKIITSTNATPNSTPVKSTPSTSPTKSTPRKSPAKLKKTPEKKDTRYTEESHNRVFENVKKIVYWVFENDHFSILFTKNETNLLKKLFDLPDQRLTIVCIRLYTRQHKWYNLANLCEELNLTNNGFNLREFYTSLASDFVSTDYSNEKIELLLDYLTVPDIQALCRFFKIRAPTKKEDKINKLLEYSTKQCTLTSLKRADQILKDQVKKKLGLCVKLKLNIKNVLYRLHLLYSLTNPDLETANDIYNLMNRIRTEMVKFAKVKIDYPLIFSDRQDFLRFADACILRQEFNDEILKKKVVNEYLLCVEAFSRLKNIMSDENQIKFDKTKPLFLRRFSAAWVYCKVLTAGSQNLGKQYSIEVCEWLAEMLKQEVYCARSRGYWHSQLALVTRAHKKDIVGEVQSIIDGLSDKHTNEVQKYELSIRGSKIKKVKISQLLYDELQCLLLPQIDVPISRTIKANVVHNNEPGRKLKYVRTTADGTEYSSVEETAINYYTEENAYTHGIHCEGQLLDALFFILFWDIIYGIHIPNTFITELQDRPLDLYSGEFYSNRAAKIKMRLKNILDDWTLDKICEFASNIYSEHSSELKSLINFDFVQEDSFHVIIRCIGKKLLAAILERFAKDYKQFHSGLPDLFLWNYKELKCCFVEVKSENDRLSTKQILWINYLHKFGAKVEVCHVEHIASRSTKKIKPKKDK